MGKAVDRSFWRCNYRLQPNFNVSTRTRIWIDINHDDYILILTILCTIYTWDCSVILASIEEQCHRIKGISGGTG